MQPFKQTQRVRQARVNKNTDAHSLPSTPPPSLSPLYWSATQSSPSARTSRLLHPFRRSRRGRDLLLDLPIAGRLALGFLLAALIAAVASGIIGLQRSQSLTSQSNFYQSLLQTNTSLTSGASFLQLMNVEAHTTLSDASAVPVSQETLTNDEEALQGLTSRYNTILTTYLAQQLVDKHPDELVILREANRVDLVKQQRVLASSTFRTWQFYQSALSQLLKSVTSNNLNSASYIERYQAEPTNADAQSALRSLVSLDARLASSVQVASNVEVQNQIITTILAAVIACLGIIIVGLIISNTLVRRLTMLQGVSQQVERGHLESRATVIGRDEIADVSLSMNAMLDTIVGLLEEAQLQRDTLTQAAQQLFAHMQVMSAGELRSNPALSDDPMNLLTDAFNFTIGRFRRFIMRTQTHIEQLEVVSHLGMKYADAFMRALRPYASNTYTTGRQSGQSGQDRQGTSPELVRLSIAFLQDVIALTRQVNAVAQEMRQTVTAFKMDSGDTK